MSITQSDVDIDAGLILAAEECPPEMFERYHRFSSHDEVTLRKLSAHGPVLIRGGRGSGKSALLLEAHRRMSGDKGVLPVYLSLRYLPLLQSDGEAYVSCFCALLSQAVTDQIAARGLTQPFGAWSDQMSLRLALSELAQSAQLRIVLLFDDAAHLGREKPLEAFFDLFRTLSSSLTSCKAAIYPGVTKFGVRFDVFNDSTVIDISRVDVSQGGSFFPEVVAARYPKLAEKDRFSDRLSSSQFANLLGRAVVGNMRGFILACNRFDTHDRVGIPELTRCFVEMATDYYWPLMEEVAPKLGVYEPLIEPARRVFELLMEHVALPVREGARLIAQDRILIHRDVVSRLSKIFEILEYLGFVARREASRGMKSGGRGPVFAMNLCNLLDAVPTKRLTTEMIGEWLSGVAEPAEIHVYGQTLVGVALPMLSEEHGLAILAREIGTLATSRAYPYGLTDLIIERLHGAGIQSVGDLAAASDVSLDAIEGIGKAKIRRIRNVLNQAIWM